MNQDEYHKQYEYEYNKTQLNDGRYVACRIDGRSFHTFCKNMNKPFDTRLIYIFENVTRKLVEETGASCGYTQSDEISLAWVNRTPFFEGKQHKMTSVIASLATVYFNQYLREFEIYRLATFDTRVWSLPTIEDMVDYFYWRWQDCVKNSISMTASCYFSHKALLNVKSIDRIKMLKNRGIDWYNMSDKFRFGQFLLRKKIIKFYNDAERATLPENHQFKHSNQGFERTVIENCAIDFDVCYDDMKLLLFGPLETGDTV